MSHLTPTASMNQSHVESKNHWAFLWFSRYFSVRSSSYHQTVSLSSDILIYRRDDNPLVSSLVADHQNDPVSQSLWNFSLWIMSISSRVGIYGYKRSGKFSSYPCNIVHNCDMTRSRVRTNPTASIKVARVVLKKFTHNIYGWLVGELFCY